MALRQSSGPRSKRERVMRITSLFAVLMLLFVGSAWAQGSAEAISSGSPSSGDACLLVKHKGVVGRRLAWFFLIGVPIAPGAKFDYVDAIDFQQFKTSYTSKDLQKLQTQGVHVIVLNERFVAADLESARKACSSEPTTPAVAEAK